MKRYSETQKTRGVKEQNWLQRRVLDHPAAATRAAKRVAAVTLPAASLPAGREHLPLDEVLISAALRHAPLHLLQNREGSEPSRSEGRTKRSNDRLLSNPAFPICLENMEMAGADRGTLLKAPPTYALPPD